MNTLSIVIFVIGFEGEIKMAGVLQTVMDNFFGSIPEKQFVGFSGEKKDKPKKGLGTKPTVVRDVDFDAYEDMMNKEEKTSSVEVIAKHYADIIKEESKDPDTGEDRASKVNNNVVYTKGVTTVEDVESQGFYVDKILRDNARDPSNRLGSTEAPLNKKEGYYNKIRELIDQHNKDTTFTPYVSSRGVDALEGPEASGPISGPVKAGEKELTTLEKFAENVRNSREQIRGFDPEGLASPKRTPRSSRDVYALEGPEALGERGLGARPEQTITPPKVDEMQITESEDFYLKIGKIAESDHGSTPVITADAGEASLPDADKSMDIGFGHKIKKGSKEDTSGMIYGIKYKKADGTYIPLTQEQKVKILNKDMAKNLNLARKDSVDKNNVKQKGWDSKLKDIGTSWDKLDTKYQNVLTSLAYNVGGTGAGQQWKAVLQAAKDENILDFAKELRREDGGKITKGMDNRVIRELYAAGIIDSFEDVSSVLPLASYASLIGDGIPLNDRRIDPSRLANP